LSEKIIYNCLGTSSKYIFGDDKIHTA